jgi:type III pantothenate kinase
MRNHWVFDVGNTCLKFADFEDGRLVGHGTIGWETADEWRRPLERLGIGPDPECSCIVAGVHPERRDVLVLWLQEQGWTPCVLDSHKQLPLAVRVDQLEKVGIDRLLNAVAANQRRPAGSAVVIVDAGSAVTVDLVDETGAFCGGAILPGFRLMAHVLHEHTALLPLVDVDAMAEPPGRSTIEAIRVGVSQSVIGGIERIIAHYRKRHAGDLQVFVTGGDGPIVNAGSPVGELWPEMTLTGILLGGEAALAHG